MSQLYHTVKRAHTFEFELQNATHKTNGYNKCIIIMYKK